MAEKATMMVLKVDLQCPRCYKKVKKILCKFPQIRNQVYDEKANTVTIPVVCCNPEKLRDELCCEGSKVIKSIEIKERKAKPNYPPNYPVPVRNAAGHATKFMVGAFVTVGMEFPCDGCYWYGYGPSGAFYLCKCDYCFSHDDPRGCYVME